MGVLGLARISNLGDRSTPTPALPPRGESVWRLQRKLRLKGKNMLPFALVGIGGGIGAMIRYGVSLLIGRLWPSDFPLATLLINITGSLAMGLLIGWMAKASPQWGTEIRLFVAVGIFGGYTTFSSFSLDTITLIERGQAFPAALYMLVSVAVSLIGLYLGLLLTRGMPA